MYDGLNMHTNNCNFIITLKWHRREFVPPSRAAPFNELPLMDITIFMSFKVGSHLQQADTKSNSNTKLHIWKQLCEVMLKTNYFFEWSKNL